MIIGFEGPSGVGKSTLAHALAAERGWPLVGRQLPNAVIAGIPGDPRSAWRLESLAKKFVLDRVERPVIVDRTVLSTLAHAHVEHVRGDAEYAAAARHWVADGLRIGTVIRPTLTVVLLETAETCLARQQKRDGTLITSAQEMEALLAFYWDVVERGRWSGGDRVVEVYGGTVRGRLREVAGAIEVACG